MNQGLVRVAVIVGTLSIATTGCSGDDAPASAAASSFCIAARAAMTLDPAGLNLDDQDLAAQRAAWTTYLAKVDAAQADVPSALADDYERYATWLHEVEAALDRHGYVLADAVSDEHLVELMGDTDLEQARTNVEGYVSTECLPTTDAPSG